jgi:uncharacterized protein YcbK (DUF882 family)
VLIAVTFLTPPSAIPAAAAGSERTLYLYYTHTKETGTFTFKRNGQYDRRVLAELNHFLRDWRRGEDADMDPALFDLLWEVYREVGGNQPIHIVSAYRSPATNAMLAARSSAVADNSQHMKGKAMDFFIPGVQLSTLRAIAIKHQVGGVGYYPTSGSPFVHLDTGSVRAWPRMTRAQLQKIFPDGRTLHLPSDGTPLSSDGRRYAEAEWSKCHRVPCQGGGDGDGGGNLFEFLFGGDNADVQVAALAPSQRTVSTIAVNAPVPAERPMVLGAEPVEIPFGAAPSDELAPIPATKSPTILLATGPSLPFEDGETALVALANLAPQPESRSATGGEPELVTAYVPAIPAEPGAQRALEMIIARSTTAALPAPTKVPSAIEDMELRTAALGSQPETPAAFTVVQGLVDMTWKAIEDVTAPPLTQALLAKTAAASNHSFNARDIELFAPDIDHVTETMVQPDLFSSSVFGTLYEAEGHLAKETELGPLTTRMGVIPAIDPVPVYDQFDAAAPLLVAQR